MLGGLIPACIISGITLITLSLLKKTELMLDLMLSIGIFAVVFGIGAWCAVRGTDKKIDSEFQKMSRKFCQETKKLIKNQKKLRNMDHAFRLLLFIEALAVVKKHFSEEPDSVRTNQRDRSAR
jgi:anaerobic C4-dicarboxylate transporter